MWSGGGLEAYQDLGSLRPRDERGEASAVSGELDIERLSFELIAQEMVGRGRIGLRQLGRRTPISARLARVGERRLDTVDKIESDIDERSGRVWLGSGSSSSYILLADVHVH